VIVVAGMVFILVGVVLAWLVVSLIRHPELRFWRHPLLLGPFPRVRVAVGGATTCVGLVLGGVSMLLD
jgi:hypothetical protein